MAKSPERLRAKFRGRKSDHTFLRLPHYVLHSPEWRALSGYAVKFLVELAAAYNGRNNGDLSLTRRQALERGWRSGGTRDRAAQEAVEAGFAVITRHGIPNGRCTLYAITWEPIDDVGNGVEVGPEKVASRAWQKREGMPHNGARAAP
jgi:hypothetical protein